MATPNYGYEKRQKELAKKRKKEEKLKRKAEGKTDDDVDVEGEDVVVGDAATNLTSDSALPDDNVSQSASDSSTASD